MILSGNATVSALKISFIAEKSNIYDNNTVTISILRAFFFACLIESSSIVY